MTGSGLEVPCAGIVLPDTTAWTVSIQTRQLHFHIPPVIITRREGKKQQKLFFSPRCKLYQHQESTKPISRPPPSAPPPGREGICYLGESEEKSPGKGVSHGEAAKPRRCSRSRCRFHQSCPGCAVPRGAARLLHGGDGVWGQQRTHSPSCQPELSAFSGAFDGWVAKAFIGLCCSPCPPQI